MLGTPVAITLRLPSGSRDCSDDEEESPAAPACHHHPKGHVCMHVCVYASEHVLVCACKHTSASVQVDGMTVYDGVCVREHRCKHE